MARGTLLQGRTLKGAGSPLLPNSVVSVSPGSRYDIRSELNFHVPPTIDGLITSYTPSRGRARNALAPLTVPSYDGSGQNVEPSVVHVPAGFTDANGSVWFYLMAVSGYFQGNANFENPQIRGSVDGQTWSTITGAADPLVAQPSSGHNFDQSIALGPDGKIYITFFQSGTGDGLDHLYYISSSDLVDWGGGAGNAASLTQIWQTTTSALRYNTANIQWDGTQWHMWAVRFVGGNALLHWTASTLLGLAGATPVTGTITIPAGRNLWETNIIRIGGLWVGLITTSTDTSGSGSYLHLMTSPDGNAWTLGQAPVLKPMFTGSQIGGATPWDAGSVYRAGLAAINTGRGGPRLAVWYSANDGAGTPTWKVGYTEIWFADDFAPRDARAGGNVGGQWYGGALSGVKAATTLTLNRLYLAPAYSGEDGLIVQRLGAQIQTSISTAVLRMGIYLINDQLHPFRWAAGTAWATLLSEATGTIDCSQTPAMYSSLLPTTPSNFVYIPPRTWFAVGGAGQTAAPKLDTGNGVLGLTTPLGNVTSPYSNSANNALYMDGQTGALPQSFVPTGIVGNDAGVGYQLASAANQPNYT